MSFSRGIVSRLSSLSVDRGTRPPPPYPAESTQAYQEVDTSALPKYGSLPPEQLTLTPDPFFISQIFVSGGTRTPDLTASIGPKQDLYHFETDSTLVYHETYVKDLRTPRSLFRIVRKPVQNRPDGTWRYTIHSGTGSRGKEGSGTKILEIDTEPGMTSSGLNKLWSTRLIFRNAMTSELDGFTLQVAHEGSGRRGEVLYEGKKVADIIDHQRREPSYEIRIFRDGLDPLLTTILAYVMDDRVMDNKRRHRTSPMSGFAGIGKGPGAGLAGAYGLGALM